MYKAEFKVVASIFGIIGARAMQGANVINAKLRRSDFKLLGLPVPDTGDLISLKYNIHLGANSIVYQAHDITIVVDNDHYKPEEEEIEMQNHLVELLLENFYTVGIRFKNSNKTYTYKCDLDLKVEEEDKVIVETSTGYEIVTVVRVDEDASGIDLTLNVKYKFIVQKLNLTRYDELVEKDSQVATVVAKGAAEKAKRELLAEYCGALDDKQIKMLEDCGAKAVKQL